MTKKWGKRKSEGRMRGEKGKGREEAGREEKGLLLALAI